MTVLIIVLAVLCLLILPLFINFHLIFEYDEVFSVKLAVLCFRFNLIRIAEKLSKHRPRKKNEKKNKSGKNPTEKPQPEKKKTPGDVREFLEFVTKLVRTATSKFAAHLKIDLKRLEITVATDDAAKTALFYGAVIGAVTNLDELMRQFARYRSNPEKISVNADFTKEKTTAKIKIVFTVKPVFTVTTAIAVIAEIFRSKEKNKTDGKGKEKNNERNTTQTDN